MEKQTLKLDPEFKAKWLEALKGGEYKKGENVLYNNIKDSYCCLGVACIVLGITKEQLIGGAILSERLEAHFGIEFPKAINYNYYEGYPNHSKLTWLNDKSDTFLPVIEYIEQNL